MSEPVAVPRQATFNTEPADSVVSGGSIKRGNVELPVVDSPSISIKKRAADINNNDDDCTYDNSDGHCTSIGNDLQTVNDENDTADIDQRDIQDQPLYNHQHKNALPRSNQSSPIYGSKSAYENFNKKHRATKRQPSLYEDSSDLEILSDVGLADDSDCDVVPVVTPLSLSARRKTRKEPRIKIPSSKVDNTEPTIQEETTQDILNIFTPETTSGVVSLKSRAAVPNQGLISQKPGDKVNQKLPGAQLSKPANNDYGNAIKVIYNDHDTLSIIKDELESSFCESDWQPRKLDSEEGKIPPVTSLAVSDKRAIIKKLEKVHRQDTESDRGPLTARETKVNHIETDVSYNRPRSAGDKPKPKLKEVTAENHKATFPSKTLDLDIETAESSRPPTRSAAPTPIISNFLEEGGETSGVESNSSFVKKTKTAYSGVPRRSQKVTRETLPKDSDNKDIRLTLPSIQTRDDMETSDGYDYESETFEEILQDRNAMVKAERTYQKRIKQLEEELKGMINQCQALSDENKELRKTIDGFKQSEKERTGPTIDSSQSTVELTARIARLESEKENLIKLNEKISLSVKADSNKAKQSEAVFVENTKLKSKNSELEKKVQLLNHDVEDLNSRLSEANNASQSGQSAVLDFKNKELKVALGELKYENKGLLSKVKSLENDKHLITNSLEDKRIELNELMRAMQTETSTESELKQSRVKLETAQEEINNVRNDLEQMKKMLQDSENKKERLQNGIGQRDSEIRRLRGEQENKDKIISDLRSTNERLKGDILKHEENRQVYKDMEHDTAALKSRIGSLKTEIESSLIENQRLKYEREEANKEIDRLRNENAATADAVHESRKYFRKWETERESRNKAEVELAKKTDEVNGLHASLKETGMKLNVLYGRVRAAEEDKERYRGPNAQELETNNKILRDENKKVRQMLIERNIELANKTNEKEVLDNRVGILEKKQKDAEFRVKQLSGWVDSMNSNDHKPSDSQKIHKQHSNAKHLPPRPSLSNASRGHHQASSHSFNSQPSPKRTGVKEPIIAVISPRSRKKRTAHSTMTPPPSWDDKGRYNDVDGPNHTPLSLPLINESNKPRTPNEDFSGSYFHLYRERMKKARDKRHAFD